MDFHLLRGVLAKFFPTMVWRLSPVHKKIYLTFDDGPMEGITDWVLDVLQEKKVKATFFVVGDNVRKYPEVMKRVAFEQSYANHTYHHIKGWSNGTEYYIENVKACDQIMEQVTGSKVAWNRSGDLTKPAFRPPYGRIKTSQLNALKDHYEIIMWDVLTGDYDPSLPIEKTFSRICHVTRSGSVIVFHDSVKAEKQMKSLLPRYIDYCKAQGYSFESLW
jgi:peptidoglycan-N-acetylglucosamine deacetylase